MKVALLLAACCLFLCAYASPITTVESALQNSSPPVVNSVEKTPESGRQAPADGTNPAPAVTDDDDDDDDDEDVDLDITDDDDDDDDSDETEDDDDDDDEDYFERFFDDILGDDDDDDDDDAKPPAAAAATPVLQSTPQQTPVVQPQVSRPSLTPDYSNLDYTAPGETLSADSGANGEATVYDDITPEEQAAGVINHQDDNIASEAVESALDTTYDNTDIQKPPESVQPVSTSDDDDDDDDDDEDDLDVSLEEDDDDDDDDEEDDDEDDDDDDEDEIEDVVGDDVIEAKRARSLEANTGSGVPPVYIAKYNRFVDNIMERINRILRKNYDPVNVRLHNNNNNNNNNNKNKNNNKSNKKNNKNRRRRPAGSKKNKRPGHHRSAEDFARSTNEPAEVTMNESLAAISAQLAEGVPALSSVSYNATEPTSTTVSGMATTELATTKRSENGLISRARPNNHRRKNNNNNKKNKKNKNKGRQRPVARATLYGLSSLRREGDVTVNMMSSHTTVKTKFTVGPLILKVEKEFGRGAKKDIRSATATTTEMTGKLNLRVMHGGAATLHSIRVMQPKQVRVESSDDHDKTREYVWKRSSHIAHVVSQKLTNATKSMLQPPPLQTTSFLG